MATPWRGVGVKGTVCPAGSCGGRRKRRQQQAWREMVRERSRHGVYRARHNIRLVSGVAGGARRAWATGGGGVRAAARDMAPRGLVVAAYGVCRLAMSTGGRRSMQKAALLRQAPLFPWAWRGAVTAAMLLLFLAAINISLLAGNE